MAALSTNDRESLLANRYQLQQVLGQGGFGRTFLALDRHCFDRLCVVKEFLPQQQGDNEIRKSRELFLREARILDRIDSPQVPKFLACFEENRQLFLVQEYIKGQTYAHLLRERKRQGRTFSEREVIQWLKELLPVLIYLHELQIVHRDISLDNAIRHEESHLPVLIDFGIGKSALIIGQSGNRNHDPQKSIVGKIGYAPYEQIWLGQSFPSSDLYALAVSAVVMLTGCNPQACDRLLLIDRSWQLQHAVSAELARILDRMLQDIPNHRYQTAKAALADLVQSIPDSRVSTPAADRAISSLNALPTVLQSQLPNPIEIPSASRVRDERVASVLDRLKSPNDSVPQNPAKPIAICSPTPTKIQLTPAFVAQCQRESIEYLGPIGKFLVQNAIAKNPQILPAELIDLLAQHITQPCHVDEFRSKLRKSIDSLSG
jgi:serine/threonine protein kinase